MNPGARFRVGHKYSQFWPILASFVDYYLLVWGCGVISTIDEPRGAFTCRSSTPVVFVESGLFHGLLLPLLVSRTDFTIDEPRGAFKCRSSTPTVLADSGPYR